MQDSPENYGGQPANLRSWRQAALRGIAKKCPQCGRGRLFSSYTTTAKSCAQCGLDLTGHQADDAPPYLTILLVGHVTIPAALAMRQLFDPPMWLQYAIWLPMVLLAAFWILPVAKGGLIGIQWANRMHGFGEVSANPDP